MSECPACASGDTVFDRSICACGVMHYYCTEGHQVDACVEPSPSFRPDTPAQEHADAALADAIAWLERSRDSKSPSLAQVHARALLAEVERLTAELKRAAEFRPLYESAVDRAEAAEALAERRGEALRQIKPLVTGDLPPLTPLPMTMRCVRIADIIDAALADEGQA